MKYTREYVEQKGRVFRQPATENGEWLQVNALGIPMYVRKDDFSVTPCLVNDGFWESWITAWVLNEISPETFFIDIGANTGYYAFIASNVAMRTIAFEPNPDYVSLITESKELNSSNVEIVPHAISDKHGLAELSIPGQFEGSASITPHDFSEYKVRTFQVNTLPLDFCLGGLYPQRNMLIKVDAEGAEELVWDGAQQTLALHKPVWMIEYTPGAYGKDFLSKLESYGTLAWINHAGEEEPITKEQIIAHADWLMLVIRPKG